MAGTEELLDELVAVMSVMLERMDNFVAVQSRLLNVLIDIDTRMKVLEDRVRPPSMRIPVSDQEIHARMEITGENFEQAKESIQEERDARIESTL